MNLKIISGGQTGIDRMGLEVARELGLPTGGTAPKGYRTEDGPDLNLATFGLREHPKPAYVQRTRQNVVDSDGTVIEVGGGLYALGKLVFGSSQAVTTATAAANAAKAATPPANAPAKSEDKKSAAEQKADKLSQKQRPGQDFTKAGKKAVKDLNKEKNNGQTTCEKCGVNTQNGKQHVKGETPSDNETNVDYIDAKSKGGSGTPDNGQVLCRKCNIEKSDH